MSPIFFKVKKPEIPLANRIKTIYSNLSTKIKQYMKYISTLFAAVLILVTTSCSGELIDYSIRANVNGTFDGTPFSNHDVLLTMTAATDTIRHLDTREFAYYNVDILHLEISGDVININTTFINNDYVVFAYQGPGAYVGFGSLNGKSINPVMDVVNTTENMFLTHPYRVEAEYATLDSKHWETADGRFSLDTPNGYNTDPIFNGAPNVPEPTTYALLTLALVGGALILYRKRAADRKLNLKSVDQYFGNHRARSHQANKERFSVNKLFAGQLYR